jgi:hypothetical protein
MPKQRKNNQEDSKETEKIFEEQSEDFSEGNDLDSQQVSDFDDFNIESTQPADFQKKAPVLESTGFQDIEPVSELEGQMQNIPAPEQKANEEVAYNSPQYSHGIDPDERIVKRKEAEAPITRFAHKESDFNQGTIGFRQWQNKQIESEIGLGTEGRDNEREYSLSTKKRKGEGKLPFEE